MEQAVGVEKQASAFAGVNGRFPRAVSSEISQRSSLQRDNPGVAIRPESEVVL